MSLDIDKERTRFEAAHPNFALCRSADGPYCAWIEDRWQGWLAAKREASTEPSALVESLRAALRSVNAVAIERGDKFGACDQVDNDGQPHQSQWFADLLAGGAAGALTDDAKDAARWRFRKQFLENGGAIMWSRSSCQLRRAGELVASAATEQDAIDAAIEARTKAGGGKGEG